MKKLLILVILLNLNNLLFGALSATGVWEVRTTGSTDQSGYFKSDASGTDYSQQDSAQLSLTDLAMTTGGTTMTSATGGFTSAMVGNGIYISSGTNFTVGVYEITGYTDTNTVTIDRDATTGSNGSSGVGKVGGATSNIQLPEDNIVAGMKIYVKSGDYTGTSTAVLLLKYDVLSYWYGYDSSRSISPYQDNRPSINGESVRIAIDFDKKNSHYFYNFIFKNSSSAGVVDIDSGGLFNCRVTNSASDGIDLESAPSLIFIEMDNNGGNGARSLVYTTFGITIGIYAHDNSGDGMYYNYVFHHRGFINSIFESNSNRGLRISRGSSADGGSTELIQGCTFYNNTSDGLYLAPGTWNYIGYFYNNIFSDTGGYGLNFTANGQPRLLDFNSYYNNTSGNVNNVTIGSHSTTTDPKFTDAPNADFSLQSDSPCVNAGISLTTTTDIATDLNINIGIAQGDETASSGGGTSYAFEN